MPHLNASGSFTHGTTGVGAWLDNQKIDQGGDNCWFTDGVMCYRRDVDGSYIVLCAPGGTPSRAVSDPASPFYNKGATTLRAQAGVWAAFLNGVGLFSSTGLGLDNGKPDKPDYSGASLYDVGPDGAIAFKPVYQSGGGCSVHTLDGREWVLTGGPVDDLQLLGENKVIWRIGPDLLVNALPPVTYLPGDKWRPKAFMLSGEWWVSYFSAQYGLVFHPFSSTVGYRVAGGTSYFDVRVVNGKMKVIFALTEGEAGDVQQPPLIDPASPREELSVPQTPTIPPVNKPLYLGWYEFKQRPGGYPPVPGNCVMNVFESGAIRRLDTGVQFAQWVTGNSVAEISNAVHNAALPCFAYWDALDWPSWPTLRPQDWLCIQANCPKEWEPEVFEAAIIDRLNRAPAGQKKALSCQAYTNVPPAPQKYTNDISSLVPVFARLAKRSDVEFLLCFSDYGRAGGMQDHPEIRPLWEQVHATVTFPKEEDMALKPPVVTVDNWNLSDVLPGREFRFHDSGNPDLGLKVRVVVDGNNMRAEIENKVGKASTGAQRTVTPCSQGQPVPPDPIPPDPVPPDPGPDPIPPDPQPPSDFRRVLLSRHDQPTMYVSKGPDDVLRSGSPTVVEVHDQKKVDGTGNRIVGLKIGGFVATEGDFRMFANRPNVGSDWEEYSEMVQADGTVGYFNRKWKKYLSMHDDGTIRADADALLGWESLKVEDAPTSIAYVGPYTRSERKVLMADGTPYFGVGVTWFTGAQDMIQNPPKADAFIDAITVRRRKPAQFVRIICMYWDGIGYFDPRTVSNFPQVLRSKVDYLKTRGLNAQIVVNADCQHHPMGFVPQFFTDVSQAMQGATNVWMSGGNEMPFNGFDAGQLAKPSGMLSGRCSMGTDALPYNPPWDQTIFEFARGDDFERSYKSVYDLYTGDTGDVKVTFTSPVFADEMIGIGEAYEPGRTTNDPFKCWQLTAGTKLMGGCGIIAHLREGIAGNVPGPIALDCLDAMIEAGELPFGDHAYPAGSYTRGLAPHDPGAQWNGVYPQNTSLPVLHHDIEPSDGGYPGSSAGTLRTHAMIIGNTADVIAPGPGPNYRITEANGWRISERFTFRDKPTMLVKCIR